MLTDPRVYLALLLAYTIGSFSLAAFMAGRMLGQSIARRILGTGSRKS